MAKWWEQQERAGYFWLKLTLVLTGILPYCVLKILAYCVGVFYFCFCFRERRSIIDFRDNLRNYLDTFSKEQGEVARERLKHTRAVDNFLSFGLSICDKFLVWQGKMPHSSLCIKNEDKVIQALIGQCRGQILLVSHFGNIEIVRCFAHRFGKMRLVVLMYTKHSQEFVKMINAISKTYLEVIEVSTLDVEKMLELRNILESGGHIAVMADRVGLNERKIIPLEFLGKTCFFPQGIFLLAGLLKVPLSTLWCYKQNGKYCLELQEVCECIELKRNKEASIKPYMQIYIQQLEEKVLDNPSQWYNFYDFWRDYTRG